MLRNIFWFVVCLIRFGSFWFVLTQVPNGSSESKRIKKQESKRVKHRFLIRFASFWFVCGTAPSQTLRIKKENQKESKGIKTNQYLFDSSSRDAWWTRSTAIFSVAVVPQADCSLQSEATLGSMTQVLIWREGPKATISDEKNSHGAAIFWKIATPVFCARGAQLSWRAAILKNSH